MSTLTSYWYVDVEVETFLVLFLDEWQNSLEVFHSFQRQRLPQLLLAWNALWTDRAKLQGHPDAIPLLEGPSRRHEPKLTLQHRCILQPKVGFYLREVLAGQVHYHPSQLAKLGFDHSGSHLRGAYAGPDHVWSKEDLVEADTRHDEAQVVERFSCPAADQVQLERTQSRRRQSRKGSGLYQLGHA